ncbi:extracellular developmental signal biosynthesis protein [Grosmannia clavigera kw1407]|uniref:Glutamine synthetase n=1 Tax=Grosmannia clavigera (strain kw1407 / UAMH 11150) TaxID=655863 RepID=F0XFS3_GROCL|nr:extracellular developmental signal biosynthesis protein [Grosmannia clavigera kw1407]EFX03677.1 extracellular developmental signal biosynthesis protein [Grosmannia clavigera kw1407]
MTMYAVTNGQLASVVKAVRLTPVIDHHAHPLLKPECVGRHPLLSIISEAHGDALEDSASTFAYHRAVKQLAAVLGCGSTWKSVVAAIEQRRSEDYNAWVSQCLHGIETVLLDDGLDNEDDAFQYTWHNRFTRSKCYRIVRIEVVAAEIINRHLGSGYLDTTFDSVLEEFDTKIKQAIADPKVAGFKSVICYRTGLDIPGAVDLGAAREVLSDIVSDYTGPGRRFRRLQHAGLSELFPHRTAILIRDSAAGHKKPIQFHTGLGDNDITLTKSSPAHLQEFIRTYPTVPIILLHSGYPYMRDTAYLAAMYANVYADIGEVFPFLSRDGQESVIREIFELCPGSKIMWSTDGHWLPETYLLAVTQVREVLETVLCDNVRKGDISWQSAIDLTRDVFFRNANRLYQLGLNFSELTDVAGDGTGPQIRKSSDLEIWEAFLRENPRPDFVRISWIDYTAKPRMKMVPFRRFDRLVKEGKALDIGIAKASLGMLQNDVCIPTVSPTGEYRLHPDLSSLKTGPLDGHANMYGDFRGKDGSPVSLCPRTQLARAVNFAAEKGISHLIGFEIEFVLLKRTGPEMSEPIANKGHAWSSSRFFVDPAIPQLLRDIVNDLAAAGIEVEQLHAESAPGQFELVLPAQPPVKAVDALLHARETISARANAAGFRYTLHPKYDPRACGTAAHMHLSVSTLDGGSVETNVYEQFYAGILEHLPSIVAFTYSYPPSYLRMIDSCWAGGRWVAWGKQNRETPLRQIEDSHWELKCMDGLANPYLAVTAILAAGLSGIVHRKQLTLHNCVADPATLSDAERSALGITTMLPASLSKALEALTKDTTMDGLLGTDVVQRYVDVKKAELQFFDQLSMQQQHEWIVERF